MDYLHIPVLVKEALECLNPKSGVYVDATLGLGGHTEAILKNCDNCLVIAFEIDIEAVGIAKERLDVYERSGRLNIVESSYTNLQEVLSDLGFSAIDGIIADFGVSNLQLSNPSRGFSYKHDAPLDMRMDPTNEFSAWNVVNEYPLEKLEKIIKLYGEEPFAKKIAKKIYESRPINTTRELVGVISKALPEKYKRTRKRHFATKTFQAIRIEVNKELDNIKIFLEQLPSVLKKGGRAVFISFHSLEDRIIKNFLKNSSEFRVITKKPIVPSKEEVSKNPKARSAKLRAAERI